MRFLFFSLFTMALYLDPFLEANVPKRSDLPNVIDYVMNCFAEEQSAKNLVPVEKITDFDQFLSIRKLGFVFDYYETLNILSARALITGLAKDLVQKINSSPKLRSYLAVIPFTEKEVVLRLRLRKKNCGFVYPELGNIAYVSVIDGMIIYDTKNSFTYDLDTLRTESFAEALSILNK